MRARNETVGLWVIRSAMPANLFKTGSGEFEYRSRAFNRRTTMEAIEKVFAKSESNESTAHAAANASQIGPYPPGYPSGSPHAWSMRRWQRR
jgi:hypothetical protein